MKTRIVILILLVGVFFISCSSSDERLNVILAKFPGSIILNRTAPKCDGCTERFTIQNNDTISLISISDQGKLMQSKLLKSTLTNNSYQKNIKEIIKTEVKETPIKNETKTNKLKIYCLNGTKAVSENNNIYLLGTPSSYDDRLLDRITCY